jgi:hypothetical protein
MKVLISGSSGLLGSHLVAFLRSAGHEVKVLSRVPKPDAGDQIFWDIQQKEYTLSDFEGFDAVVNLAGENISNKRWSQEVKQEIFRSRSVGTELLSSILASVHTPPKVLINASAVGYYGDTGDTIVTEETSSGSGFLAFVCREWESSTYAAVSRGIRVVKLRLGVVLTSEGGMLKSILLPFKLGLGGVIGSGKQYISWIGLDDLMSIISLILIKEEFSGPVNAVAPNPVTNREFTKTLGKILRRPTIFPMPAFAAKIVFGQMAQEIMLTGQRVVPEKLENASYPFLHRDLENCLRHYLKD